jgi:type I protein arginine methyltransferase
MRMKNREDRQDLVAGKRKGMNQKAAPCKGRSWLARVCPKRSFSRLCRNLYRHSLTKQPVFDKVHDTVRTLANPFTINNMARLILWTALRGKAVLRKVPALRRLHYRMKNADAFENLFWHDLMLADAVRMEHYARAIEKHIQPGMVVADLGTGSGILACLAGMRGARVYAVEHSSIIERACELAASNGLPNIMFIQCHSRQFQPPEKLDVILHEQIGMSLVDEDMIENLLDMRDRLLKPNGLILPGYFSLFIDPVELRDNQRLPYIWEKRFHGLNFSCFKPAVAPWSAGKGYDKRALNPADVGKFLAHRQRVLELDLHTINAGSLPGRWKYDARIEKAGRLDGFCLYFGVQFDDELRFETGPDCPPTSWGCRLLRCEARELAQGSRLHFELHPTSITNAESWTWTYTVDQAPQNIFAEAQMDL